MPLTFGGIGESLIIKKIGGNEEVKRHLKNLGFVEGSKISIISKMGDNIIVSVKESRIAISSNMANRISIETV